jgi:hypothetical protein
MDLIPKAVCSANPYSKMITLEQKRFNAFKFHVAFRFANFPSDRSIKGKLDALIVWTEYAASEMMSYVMSYVKILSVL